MSQTDAAAPGLEEDVFDALLDATSRFARDRLIPAEAQVEAEDAIPPEIVDQMREMGLFGLSIPEEYGGIGLSMSQEVQVIEALCYASVVFRSVIGTTVGIGSQGVLMDGTAEQKAEWLPKLARGEMMASFALTEPDHGSDAAHIRTMARRDGSDFVINGTKRYITNAPSAGMFTLLARTDPEEKGARGVTAFLLPADTPGIHVATPDRKMGQRGAKTADVVLEDVRLPETAIIGGPGNEGKGFRTAMKVLDRGRIHLSGVATGASQRMVDIAVDYANSRKQFGVAIGQHQLVQGLMADIYAEALAGRSMVLDGAKKFDAGENITLLAAACKMFCSEMVGRVADRTVQVYGGAGYIADYGVERIYRDVRILRLYEGTTQIQQMIIGRELAKMARNDAI